MTRYRLEVWDRTNTTRQAIFRELLGGPIRHQVLGGEESLEVAVDPSDAAADSLTRGSVLRLQEVGASAFTLWRYSGADRERSELDGLTLTLRADALWMDFRHGMVRDVQADGRTLTTFGLLGLDPTSWIQDYLLPGYDGDAIAFALGTVDLTDPVDLSFEESSPLAALRLLEREAVGEAQFRLNGAGDTYLVDLLTRVGTSVGGPEIRYGKNVRGIHREEDEAEVATRLYAKGSDGLTLADARWTIGGIASLVVTFDGEHPVFEDDAFIGLYFYAGGTAYQVTDSDATAGSLTLDSVAGLSIGDEGWLALDNQGTRLPYVESPAAVATSGVRVGLHETDIPNVANLLENGDLSSWSGGLPVGWSLRGSPAVTQNTSPIYAKNGGSAARVVASAAEQGLISDAITISADGSLPYHSILAGLTIISGSVRMELLHSNGQVYPTEEQAQAATSGVYTTLRSYPVNADPLPAGTAQLVIVSHEGAAEFYLDAALVTRAIGEIAPQFLAGSGAQELWAEAAAELAYVSQERVEYRVDIADLYRADPATYPFDQLDLGDDVKIRDPAIGQETLRIVEITEDLADAAATDLVVAADAWSRPNDPWRRRPNRRHPTGTVSPPGPALSEAAITDLYPKEETATQETWAWTVNSKCAWVYIYQVTAALGTADPLTVDANGVVRDANGDPVTAIQYATDTTTEHTAAVPADGQVTYIIAEPRDSDLRPGRYWRYKIASGGVDSPVLEVEWAFSETGSTGTMWFKTVTSQVAVSTVEFTTRTGLQAILGPAAATRTQGDASVVKGGTLGAGEYEQDVSLALTRLAYIELLVTLSDGTELPYGPFWFDRGKEPTIIDLRALDQLVTGISDTDCQSMKLEHVDGSWYWEVDKRRHTWDVTEQDPQSTAGIGAETWAMRLTVRSDPIADVDANTLEATEDIVVVGPGAASEPQWVRGSCLAEPPSVGSANATLKMLADSAPGGYSVKVFEHYNEYTGWSSWVDVTSSLSPTPSSPPTSQTSYTRTTAHTRTTPGLSTVEYEWRIEIRDGSNNIVDSYTIGTSWGIGSP